jgi:hypothetical protein
VALKGLESRAPDGAVLYMRSVETPTGKVVRWQYARPGTEMFAEDWSERLRILPFSPDTHHDERRGMGRFDVAVDVSAPGPKPQPTIQCSTPPPLKEATPRAQLSPSRDSLPRTATH